MTRFELFKDVSNYESTREPYSIRWKTVYIQFLRTVYFQRPYSWSRRTVFGSLRIVYVPVWLEPFSGSSYFCKFTVMFRSSYWYYVNSYISNLIIVLSGYVPKIIFTANILNSNLSIFQTTFSFGLHIFESPFSGYYGP